MVISTLIMIHILSKWKVLALHSPTINRAIIIVLMEVIYRGLLSENEAI